MRDRRPTHFTGALRREITVGGKRYGVGETVTVPISFHWEDYFVLTEKVYLTNKHEFEILDDLTEALEEVTAEHLEDIKEDEEYALAVIKTKEDEEARVRAEEEAQEEIRRLAEEEK